MGNCEMLLKTEMKCFRNNCDLFVGFSTTFYNCWQFPCLDFVTLWTETVWLTCKHCLGIILDFIQVFLWLTTFINSFYTTEK